MYLSKPTRKKRKKESTEKSVPMEESKGPSLLSLFMSTPAMDHLPRGTTGQVVVHKEGPVMTVQRDESLPRVFRKLATEGFLSAPVLDGRQYVGFISMLDLVRHTTNLFWGNSVEQWVNFWEKEQRFQSTTVDDVMQLPDTSNRDLFPTLRPDFTTFYALETMARTGLHRMAVVDQQTNHVTGILTQSMLISWLRQNMGALEGLRTKQVSDITSELSSRAITIKESDKAINAFNKMIDCKVNGLAVVSDEGVLVGAISSRDLRGVGTNGGFFSRLFHSVRDFKREAREDYPSQAPKTHYSRKMVPQKGLYVAPSDSLLDVIRLMNDGNIHRVFVCSEESINNKKPVPTHVISQSDVLKQVLDHIVQDAGEV